MQPVIEATNISKRFKVYSKPLDILKEFLSRSSRHTDFWALQDISFALSKGEIIGFLGRNGAGKSTLLKIIAGTLKPTNGTVTIRGNVASILELGTGFNPEYSGPDNVLLGGLCLGLSRKEILGKMDWVREYSELGDFFDMPFKYYSSGMQARLTFATASCVEPDVLIIDEALAVGDIKFQVKCYERLREIKANGGTILFVSHDLNSINSFCDRAFYLVNGRIVSEGEPRLITNRYYKDMFAAEQNADSSFNFETRSCPSASTTSKEATALGENPFTGTDEELLFNTKSHLAPENKLASKTLPATLKDRYRELLSRPTSFGNGKVRIVDFAFFDSKGETTTLCEFGHFYTLVIRVWPLINLDSYRVGYTIKTSRGTHVFGTGTHCDDTHVPPLSTGVLQDFYFKIEYPFINFPILLSFGIAIDESTILDTHKDILTITSVSSKQAYPDSTIQLSSVFNIGPRLQSA